MEDQPIAVWNFVVAKGGVKKWPPKTLLPRRMGILTVRPTLILQALLRSMKGFGGVPPALATVRIQLPG
jgi:hypothetical protein